MAIEEAMANTKMCITQPVVQMFSCWLLRPAASGLQDITDIELKLAAHQHTQTSCLRNFNQRRV